MSITGRLLYAVLFICNILFLVIIFKRHGPAENGKKKSVRAVKFGVLFQTLSYPIAWTLRRRRLDPFGGGGFGPDILIAATSVLIVFASIALAAAAKKRLGRQWALAARVVEGHRLVAEGPFGRVRHPLYLAMGMLLLAVVLGLSSILGAASAVPLFAIGTAMRIRVEERLLTETFGQEYEEYRRRVPAFFPRIGRGRVPADTGGRAD